MTLHDWFVHPQPRPILSVDQWKGMINENINNQPLIMACLRNQKDKEIVRAGQTIVFERAEQHEKVNFLKFVPLADFSPFWEYLKKTTKPQHVWTEYLGMFDQIGFDKIPLEILIDFIQHIKHLNNAADPYQLITVLGALSTLKLNCPALPGSIIQDLIEPHIESYVKLTSRNFSPSNALTAALEKLESTVDDLDRHRFVHFLQKVESQWSVMAPSVEQENKKVLKDMIDVFLVHCKNPKELNDMTRELLYDFLQMDPASLISDQSSKKLDQLIQYLSVEEKHIYLSRRADNLQYPSNALFVQWPRLLTKITEFNKEADFQSLRNSLPLQYAYLWALEVRTTDQDLKFFERRFPGFNAIVFKESEHRINFAVSHRPVLLAQNMALSGLVKKVGEEGTLSRNFLIRVTKKILENPSPSQRSFDKVSLAIRPLIPFFISNDLSPDTNKENLGYLLSCMVMYNNSAKTNYRKRSEITSGAALLLRENIPWLLHRKTLPNGKNELFRILCMLYGQKDILRIEPLLELLQLKESETWDSAMSNINTILNSLPHPALNPIQPVETPPKVNTGSVMSDCAFSDFSPL